MMQPPARRDAVPVVVKNSMREEPFLAETVEFHLCDGVSDAENEGSGESPAFNLVVERPGSCEPGTVPDISKAVV